jgi:hypothetical protein
VDDDPETIQKLFKMVNFIAAKMITDAKEVAEFYDSLPAGPRAAVEKRDK